MKLLAGTAFYNTFCDICYLRMWGEDKYTAFRLCREEEM